MQSQHRGAANMWVLGAIVLLSVGFTIATMIAWRSGGAVSGRSEAVWLLAFSSLITLWSHNDNIVLRDKSPRDYPYYVMFLFWPFVLLYHLVRSRRFKGVALYLAFLATYLAPYLVPFAYFEVQGHAI